MCFKYEELYDQCFDFMEFGYKEQNLISLLKEYGIKINNKDEFFIELFKFFEKMHESKTMEPYKNEEDSSNISVHICDKCGGSGYLRSK